MKINYDTKTNLKMFQKKSFDFRERSSIPNDNSVNQSFCFDFKEFEFKSEIKRSIKPPSLHIYDNVPDENGCFKWILKIFR